MVIDDSWHREMWVRFKRVSHLPKKNDLPCLDSTGKPVVLNTTRDHTYDISKATRDPPAPSSWLKIKDRATAGACNKDSFPPTAAHDCRNNAVNVHWRQPSHTIQSKARSWEVWQAECTTTRNKLPKLQLCWAVTVLLSDVLSSVLLLVTLF